jgi:hypothetical protein
MSGNSENKAFNGHKLDPKSTLRNTRKQLLDPRCDPRFAPEMHRKTQPARVCWPSVISFSGMTLCRFLPRGPTEVPSLCLLYSLDAPRCFLKPLCRLFQRDDIFCQQPCCPHRFVSGVSESVQIFQMHDCVFEEPDMHSDVFDNLLTIYCDSVYLH